MGCTAMNQNLYGQSESSSLSCGFLINNKQRCVASRDLHEEEFAQSSHGTSLMLPWCLQQGTNGDPTREGAVLLPHPHRPTALTETSHVKILSLQKILKVFDKADTAKPGKRKWDTT